MVAATPEGLKHAFLRLAFCFVFLTHLSRSSHHSWCSFQRGLFIPCPQFSFTEACVHSSGSGSAEILLVLQDPSQCLSYSPPDSLRPASNVCSWATLFWFLTKLSPSPGPLPRFLSKIPGQISHSGICSKNAIVEMVR